MSVTTHYTLMDSNSHVRFDNVKSEKLKALRKYRRKQALIKILIHVAESCIVLYLLFSWYSSTGATFAGDFLRRLVYLSGKPLYVFFFCHLIIATIFVVSVYDNDNGQDVRSNLYDEYMSHRRRPESGYSPATVKSPEGEVHLDKQIVTYENSKENRALIVLERPVRPLVDDSVVPVSPLPVHESSNSTADSVSRPVRMIQGAEVVPVTVNHSVSPIKDGTVGERKKYRRSRSGVTRKKVEERWELRRMATEVGRKSVEELSNEEFKTTVDEYIARTRMILQNELMEEITAKGSYKVVNNCRSLVVRN